MKKFYPPKKEKVPTEWIQPMLQQIRAIREAAVTPKPTTGLNTRDTNSQQTATSGNPLHSR